MNRPLRIALTADPELLVPPRLYGGIERVVDMIGHGLTARGHEVTLFGHPDSRPAGRLVPWPGRSSVSLKDSAANATILAREVVRGRFDIVHSFSRIAYLLPVLPLSIPKLMTYQRAISRRSVQMGQILSRGSLWFSGISRWMIRHVEDVGNWKVVFNGVPLDRYGFVEHPGSEAPLVFLGRLEEIKGPHLAIDVALRTGRRLVLAGNVPPEHRAWFEREVAARVDGTRITYVGPVDDTQKNELLGRASGFLMPILWEEPFGIVMAEALACGTPVIGLRRGAVPEVVEHGVSGFVERDVDGMVAAVHRLGSIRRAACRKRAEEHFSESVVVDQYLNIYRQMLGARGVTKA